MAKAKHSLRVAPSSELFQIHVNLFYFYSKIENVSANHSHGLTKIGIHGNSPAISEII